MPTAETAFFSALRALVSYLALAGGLAALGWLALRLETLPEISMGPWEDGQAPPLVMVDAGHGGHDGGAVANGMVEKEVALRLAGALRRQLQRHGLRVRLTRSEDVFLPLDERSRMANEAGAAAFVSLHLNTSVAAPEVTGIETYFSPRQSPSLRSGADRGSQDLARRIQAHACRNTAANDRGVKEKAYAVVSGAICPAVLVECGFLTHPEEAAKLNGEGYQEQLAEGIARGVVEFLKVRPQRPAEPASAPVTAAVGGR